MRLAPKVLMILMLFFLVVCCRERIGAVFIQKISRENDTLMSHNMNMKSFVSPKKDKLEHTEGRRSYYKIISDGETKKNRNIPGVFPGFFPNGAKETRNSVSEHDHEGCPLAAENSFAPQVVSDRISAEIRFDSDNISIFIWNQNTLPGGNGSEFSES
jgi:hypothetical protein